MQGCELETPDPSQQNGTRACADERDESGKHKPATSDWNRDDRWRSEVTENEELIKGKN